jgi:hypothetical protein
MPDRRTLLICSCEDTMPLAAAAFERGCRGADIVSGHQLCRAELERVRSLMVSGAPITISCTQEAPLFREVAAESGSDVSFVNIRESAGWSAEAAKAGPKMAALVAAAAVPMPDVPFTQIESAGVALVYGRDERAIEASSLLKEHLDITALITWPDNLMPPRTTEFPIVRGTIRAAKGCLGAFEIIVDDYASPRPSSRGALVFGPARDGAVSHCDILLDVSGGPPLFPAADLRDGYLRADPGDRAAVLAAVLRARDLVGSFDKPRYVAFTADLCEDRRLPPLPRPLSDQRHCAGRRSCSDRRKNLRRLRPMRRGMSDGRGGLCVTARRCLDAQAAHLAHGLSRCRRRVAHSSHP